MTTITPTVGRVVWFYHETPQVPGGFNRANSGEPLAAIIAGVLRDEHGEPTNCVHLAAFDAHGVQHAMPYVQLVQDGETPLAGGRYATWMPYQIGQAKKADRAQDAKSMAIAAARDYEAENDRARALDMALRTAGLTGHTEVLEAANAYLAHITGQPPAVTSPDVKRMVDRFLSWKLPSDFAPDAGISFVPSTHPLGWPTGTNLLSADQARAMFEHVLRDE